MPKISGNYCSFFTQFKHEIFSCTCVQQETFLDLFFLLFINCVHFYLQFSATFSSKPFLLNYLPAFFVPIHILPSFLMYISSSFVSNRTFLLNILAYFISYILLPQKCYTISGRRERSLINISVFHLFGFMLITL